MANSLSVRLWWLVFVTGPGLARLDRIARRVEANACRLVGSSTVTEAVQTAPGLVDGRILLTRLVRADEALRSVAPGELTETSQRILECGAGEAPASSVDAAPADDALPPGSLELISLRDDALLAAESTHTTVEQLARGFFRRIGDILEREGITETEPSPALDPQRQHVVGTRDTDDPALYGQIAEVVGPGYVFKGRVIRPARVVTWRKAASGTAADV